MSEIKSILDNINGRLDVIDRLVNLKPAIEII